MPLEVKMQVKTQRMFHCFMNISTPLYGLCNLYGFIVDIVLIFTNAIETTFWPQIRALGLGVYLSNTNVHVGCNKEQKRVESKDVLCIIHQSLTS